jgi:hypothetical protein
MPSVTFWARGGRKGFFFEKKKQKTFDDAVADSPEKRVPSRKSFLVLFFKKEPLSPPHAPPWAGTPAPAPRAGPRRGDAVAGGGRKGFFFEKKKQKTFDGAVADSPEKRVPGRKSFLVLFFKKEPLSPPHSPP